MITKRLNNENGQAIFEMIIFLPFLIFLYTIFYTVGNSISASINQQKAVRGYFYQLVKGNSYIVPATDLDLHVNTNNIHTVGFYALGWAEELMQGKNPIGNCFHFSSMLKNNSTEVCNSKVRDAIDASYFIRAFTAYGICGPVFEPPSSPLLNGKQFVLDQARQMAKCELK
jgi:hypothetical protein